MKITLLGTGDAIGTPKIGCSCPQCTYAIQHGLQRLRTSFLIETSGKHILIDTSPDLRMQLLGAGSPHIDAVIWTHGHYDHFMGFGEFYRVQDIPDAYGAPGVVDYCQNVFSFLPFSTHPREPFCPFRLFGLEFTLVPVCHPPAETYGILLSSSAATIGFTSDTNRDLSAESRSLFAGTDLLFIDALAPSPIRVRQHMNYGEACALAAELEAGDFRCVHMSHLLPWDLTHTGRDGETFSFPD
ncbi:MAG TPA: MBL fold metallo-hydrolase [Methanoregulaceae archaeon]|nr:MAG: MBL fold metallo-hydrolase [Methanolinea sp.]HON81564.1 MBL fold metallo-hydrolase [Methanoregulaceae archaeon]HPD10371.1 MBL fold metallo-hydrolase [Methanoregulaceae archaeon]HRT15313.1 MBL fold metallo-hydrolase [Methanoregulaceae archaeon]HRU30963.1 MBL fold metallo-hydrolase [Methanoregulaceae archaeon]